MYLLAYGAWRFTIEFLRGDPRLGLAAGLNASQGLSLALLSTGAILFALRRGRAAA